MTHSSWIRTFIVFFSLNLFWGSAQAARIEPLYTPMPLDVGPGFTLSEVREAISDSLINAGWRKQLSQGNEVRAYHTKGRHIGRIGISYTSRLIEFHHRGSEGLDATDIDGVEYVHGLYNTWVHDLENALKFRVNQLALEHDRYAGKAPVTEVEIRPGERKTATINRRPESEVQEINTETTPVEPVVEPVIEPGLEQDTPLQGAVVHDVIVKPQTAEKPSAAPVLIEPAQSALPAPSPVPSPDQSRKKNVDIQPVENPKESTTVAEELPPVDAKPAQPVESGKDLGELKW